MITYRKRLNLVPGYAMQKVCVSQYDSDIRLEFELYTSEGTFTVESGTTVVIQGTKPDGNGISIDGTLTATQDTDTGTTVYVASFDFDVQMAAVSGKSIYELALYHGSKVLNTANFILFVEKAALDADTIQSDSVLRNLDAIIEGAATATQAAEEADDAADRAEEAARTLTIDDTLTQTGQAADAKKVGDEITALKDDFNHIDDALSINYSDVSLWESGGIDLSTGEEWETNSRIRTGYISRTLDRIKPANGYLIGVYAYDSSDTYLGMYNGTGFSKEDVYWFSSTMFLMEISLDYKLRLLAKKESESSIIPSEATNILFGSYTDTTLTQVGKAADAKAVGDAITSLSLSDAVKTALLACFAHVAWATADGEAYYDELEAAFDKSLVSITANYTQTSEIYENSPLNILRSDLVVTAYYNDSTSQEITDYTLEGTLASGSSTITVRYKTLSTSFTVVVDSFASGYTPCKAVVANSSSGSSATVNNDEVETDYYMNNKSRIVFKGTCYTDEAFHTDTNSDDSPVSIFTDHSGQGYGFSLINFKHPTYQNTNKCFNVRRGGTAYPITSPVPNGEVHVFDVFQNNSVIEDDSVIASNILDGGHTSGNAMCIFGDRHKNTSLYYFKVYEDDVLKANYVPCVRDSDAQVGLYDTVGNKFFGNVNWVSIEY